jgi:hypothetical protein
MDEPAALGGKGVTSPMRTALESAKPPVQFSGFLDQEPPRRTAAAGIYSLFTTQGIDNLLALPAGGIITACPPSPAAIPSAMTAGTSIRGRHRLPRSGCAR